MIYDFPIRHVESQSAEDLLEAQVREGFGNPFWGLSPQKCVNHRVQGNAGAFDEVTAVTLLDVFP